MEVGRVVRGCDWRWEHLMAQRCISVICICLRSWIGESFHACAAYNSASFNLYYIFYGTNGRWNTEGEHRVYGDMKGMKHTAPIARSRRTTQ